MVASPAEHPVRFWTPEHRVDGVAIVVQAVTEDGRAVNIPMTADQAERFLYVLGFAVKRATS